LRYQYFSACCKIPLSGRGGGGTMLRDLCLLLLRGCWLGVLLSITNQLGRWSRLARMPVYLYDSGAYVWEISHFRRGGGRRRRRQGQRIWVGGGRWWGVLVYDAPRVELF
jgi:hypothetical protein